MPNLDSLANPREANGSDPEPEFRVVRGIIAGDAAAIDTPLFVRIPSRDPGSKGWLWGPAPWSPRLASDSEFSLPTEGDLALVAFTEEDEPWIIEWWPYEL